MTAHYTVFSFNSAKKTGFAGAGFELGRAHKHLSSADNVFSVITFLVFASVICYVMFAHSVVTSSRCLSKPVGFGGEKSKRVFGLRAAFGKLQWIGPTQSEV